jgi:hypothetical protein
MSPVQYVTDVSVRSEFMTAETEGAGNSRDSN